MQLRSEQLSKRLQQQCDPIYLLSGDEPLQMLELSDAIRHIARERGYEERVTLDAYSGFKWDSLAAETNNLSLFSNQRLIDLRLKSAAIGNEGSKALSAYCQHPPADTLLLITMPKLDRKQLTSKWVKSVEQLGVLCQIWPVDAAQLPSWLDQRLRQRGVIPETGVCSMLAERIEGNLLAAQQEIEKLLLLNGPGPLSLHALTQDVADSSRFDVYTLMDRVLQGDATRCIHILRGLRGEGVAAPVVLWVITRELRSLHKIQLSQDHGGNIAQALSQAGVWEKRKPLVLAALRRTDRRRLEQLLQRCRCIDLAIKGMDCNDPWLLLEQVLLDLCGLPLALSA